MSRRIVISGGGTGGHIYPGLAIAQALQHLEPQTEILFIGAKGKMEMEKVPHAGFAIEGLPIQGLQRRLSLQNLAFPFKLLKSLQQAGTILRRFGAQVVVGTGGYASGAALQAAVWQGIPTLIQEQNGYAGLTNKLLARQVQRICVAYPNLEAYFPAQKLRFTGNPVRQDLVLPTTERAAAYATFGLSPHKKTVLVMGGSGGAKQINQTLWAGLPQILGAGYQVIWQLGAFYYQTYAPEIAALQAQSADGTPLYAKDFIYQMPQAYACADVVVGRAGALTISELALLGKAAILVPSPHVTADHQNKNALALGDAIYKIADADTPQNLVEKILFLLENDNLRAELSQKILKFAKPQAAMDIAREVLALCQ
ncbi:undecaprenyldiphospho-muramoylpentapeptide beta-N-acetylglucosaminyltransferase [Hugenholtzia roseola]|uniref:undecaprenyldiphospho-muramoylpentapeptide beta-N-acetylglucosaminyltransferase n=1 Tax=Hugenholtzia roseola TaxID=1002 RepID=UPI0003F50A1E|nr:undecaprenyldiphospho-muramoylpentapeptide beta-N-acetylglucosaminyltransferase [Hugenholtzia roseola]